MASIEIFVLVNLSVNVLVIAIIARNQSTIHWDKILIASAIGTVYAVAMQFEIFFFLRMFPVRIALPFCLAAIAQPTDDWWDVIKNGMFLLLATIFTGGVQRTVIGMMPMNGIARFLLTVMISLVALFFALYHRGRSFEQTRVQLNMVTDYGNVRIPALIDTGNRLREPLSGRPVVVVEEARLIKILPPGFSSEEALQNLPRGFRMVRYGSLGNTGGAMVCFRPKEVYASFGRGWMRAPDIWVALYPGKMPGSECALAPAVIGAIQRANLALGSKIKHRERSLDR